MPRRIGRPGLVGTMARTAVIAGTASAVSGSVAQNRQARAQLAQAQQQAAIDESVANQLAGAQLAAPAAPPAAPAAAPQDPTMAELKRLVEMKQQGLLTDEEFSAMKARLLGL
jgi:hemolysin activation/secretion protein